MKKKVIIKKHTKECPAQNHSTIEYQEYKDAGEDCPICDIVVIKMERAEATEHFRRQLGLK